jgi:DNA-binding MarR family transcriptional regulator
MKKPTRVAALTDPLGGQLSYELRRASVAVMTALAADLEALGLRPSEASMLIIIGANPGRTQSDVGRALRIKPANMVPIISRMVIAGALERKRSAGRSLAIHLTVQGELLLRQVRKAYTRHQRRLARALPAGAQRQLIRTLRALCDAACQTLHD